MPKRRRNCRVWNYEDDSEDEKKKVLPSSQELSSLSSPSDEKPPEKQSKQPSHPNTDIPLKFGEVRKKLRKWCSELPETDWIAGKETLVRIRQELEDFLAEVERDGVETEKLLEISES